MSVQFNHTIVWSSDRTASAEFFAEIYGLPAPEDLYHFKVVKVANGVSIDFADREGAIAPQHYALLVGEDEFTGIMERIEAVTVEQVQELAQELFRDELLNLALVGPYEDRDAFASLLTFSR